MSDIGSSIINGAYGTAQGRQGTTVQTFAISLAAGFVLFAIQFGTFLLVRNYLWAKRIFQPRSFLVPLKNRVKPPPNNPFKWVVTVFKTPEDPEVLQKAGMDAYFFLRYLSMCLKIFFPIAVIIIPIVIPLNYSGGKGRNTIEGTRYNVTGLDTLAWSNVSPQHTNRYWAHLILGLGVIVWVCYIFHEQLMHYIVKRQEYLGSPSHRLKASSTTVFISDIPKDICNTDALTELYDDFPGGIRRIWINRNFEALVNKDKRRRWLENLLENAETNLIRKAVKQKHKNENCRDGAETSAGESEATEKGNANDKPASRVEINEPTTAADCQSDMQHDMDTQALWILYLRPKQRQTMRIPNPNHLTACKIPLIGRFFFTKVDTIYYCRRELARLNKELEGDIETAESSCPQNLSAFIQFNTQKAAHLACQAVADHMPRQMSHRLVEISPADINWPALNLSSKERSLRLLLFLFLFIILIFAFGLISFFTGILSRASTLGGSTSWLRWIVTLPPWLLSFIQGTLPAVILVVLLSGPTPIILRAMTNRTRGAITGSQGERSLQLWYLIFLVFELFIIPTISSGLTSLVDELIHSPASVPNILAENLPTASNYYFSFLVVNALSISASSILQTIRLLNFYVIGNVNTPDSVYEKLSFTNRTRIGSNIGWYVTFAVIGLVYSIIAPLVLLFIILTFALFWLVIKNNILYVVRTGNVDGGGLFFPSAINQTFTGLYFMEVCLIGLFFLARDTHGNVVCEAQGIIMAVAFVLTIFYQIWLAVNFNSLYRYAPVRLEGDAARTDKEYEMERLTSVRPNDTNNESIPTEQAFDSSITKTMSNTADVPPRRDLGAGRRASSARSLAIAGISHRSTDIQNQQRKDGQSAKHILNRLNRPLDDVRLAQLESHLAAVEARVGNVLIPRQKDIEAHMMNDPISKIIMQHNDELEDLDAEDRDMLISIAFTHPVLRESKPTVWIPRDDLGVSDDEVRRTRALSPDIAIENRGAFFNRKLEVEVDKPPPDMSEFALVMAEL